MLQCHLYEYHSYISINIEGDSRRISFILSIVGERIMVRLPLLFVALLVGGAHSQRVRNATQPYIVFEDYTDSTRELMSKCESTKTNQQNPNSKG